MIPIPTPYRASPRCECVWRADARRGPHTGGGQYRLAAHLGTAFLIYSIALRGALKVFRPALASGECAGIDRSALRRIAGVAHGVLGLTFITALSGTTRPVSMTLRSLCGGCRRFCGWPGCRSGVQLVSENGRQVDPRRAFARRKRFVLTGLRICCRWRQRGGISLSITRQCSLTIAFLLRQCVRDDVCGSVLTFGPGNDHASNGWILGSQGSACGTASRSSDCDDDSAGCCSWASDPRHRYAVVLCPH
jgi:hypothetical protein